MKTISDHLSPLPLAPSALEKYLPQQTGHARAEAILQRTADYATHPKAQEFVAGAANWQMDRKNQDLLSGGLATPNQAYKPSLILALGALVEAGTLTPENIRPALSKTISTFRNIYPKALETLPDAIKPIFDAVPRTGFVQAVKDRFSPPSNIRGRG